MPPNHYRPAGRGYNARPGAPRLPLLDTNMNMHPDDLFYTPAQPVNDYRSRYNPRYDDRRTDDRRSRSPRDRSPDRLTDRGSQYGDADRRRTSAEVRTNASAFTTNRETFQPPRAPKAYMGDMPPIGPRGGFSGDYRGRGRGRGRGGAGPASWRDDSRDRGRDREFRDRRDDPPLFRTDRSRERDVVDFRRERDRDSFRGRRVSPGSRRSPPGRDFRERELQIGLEGVRRGSRDGGPLSAGSSSSDPPFAPQSYRGGGLRGRGAPRGRGDYDRGRGRFSMDERPDARFRSRSQEGQSRWAPRDRDERDIHHPDPRFRDGPREERELFPNRDPPRDPRDTTDRNVRPKLDRQGSVANEPLSASTLKAITPPLAPSAPMFGSVRPPLASDTPKAPPTGPRALIEDRLERSAPSNHTVGDTWAPPSGPSNSISPTIPTGPRAQNANAQPALGPPQQGQKQPRPSSRQWINPAIATKGGMKAPESPKINRSQSFASSNSRPFEQRPDSYSNRQNDDYRRPRSSGTGANDDGLRPLTIPENEPRGERGTQSARASIDRDTRSIPWKSPDIRTAGGNVSDRNSVASGISPTAIKTASPTTARPREEQDEKPDDSMHEDGEIVDEPPVEPSTRKRRRLHANAVRFSLPARAPAVMATADQPSDSDDDEDTVKYIGEQIASLETEIRRLGDATAAVPTEVVIRHAHITHEALAAVAIAKEELVKSMGPVPKGTVLPSDKHVEPIALVAPLAEMGMAAGTEQAEVKKALAATESHSEPHEQATRTAPEATPKIEEMEIDSAHVLIPTVERFELQDEQGDVHMEDAQMNGSETSAFEGEPILSNGASSLGGHMHLMPPLLEEDPATATNSPTPMEEDEYESEMEVDSETLDKVRAQMQTPPLDDLPSFTARPWQKSNSFMKSMDTDANVEKYIANLLAQSATFARADQDEKRMEYKVKYEQYLRFTMSEDPIAVKSRDAFNKANEPVDGSGPVTNGPETKGESRRGRFATERDLERVMQQSLLDLKEKEERESRAEKLKRPKDCEAVIPDMFWTPEDRQKELFRDTSGLVDPDKLVALWEVLPPKVNYTEEEAGQFEKAYLECPKQWGKIAEVTPNRDFKAHIQYYYLMKNTLNLKEKLKKQPKKKKRSKAKARVSTLAFELGNPEDPQEDSAEAGEDGRRARPRRAAAPTWDFEKPADSVEGTPAATPGGRKNPAPKPDGNSAEKPDKPPRKRRTAKEKEPKQPKTPQILAPVPAIIGTSKVARSRSNSKVPPPAELLPTQNPTPDIGRVPLQFERRSPMPAMPTSTTPIVNHIVPPSEKIPDMMAPPALRPEPIPPPLPSNSTTFEFGPHNPIAGVATEPDTGGRATPATGASSYWSVNEQNAFADLLKSFGTNWHQISRHMTTKTHTMVKNFYTRRSTESNPEWVVFAADADAKISRNERLPTPPDVAPGPRNKKYDIGTSSHRHASSVDGADDSVVPASKLEKTQPPPINTNIPRPIAQAPSQHQLQQQFAVSQSPGMIDRMERAERAERKPLSSQPGTPSLEAVGRHARSMSAFAPERETEFVLSQQQQPIRHTLKSAPMSALEQPPTLPSQAMPSRAGFADFDTNLNLINSSGRQRKPQLEPKDDQRLGERQSLKQEPDSARFEVFVHSQAPSRPRSVKPMPDRRAEQPRSAVPPPSQAYAGAPHPMMHRELAMENTREPARLGREHVREHRREPSRNSIRETPGEHMREPPRDHINPMRDPMSEQMREVREPLMTAPVDERRIASMPSRMAESTMGDARTPDSRIHTPVDGPSQMQVPNPVRGHPRAPNPASNPPPRIPNPNMVETPTRAPQPGYFDSYGVPPSRPSPTPSAAAAPKPAAPSRIGLAFLLNDDDPAPTAPAPPKRVDEVARGMSTTSSPPPQRGVPPPSAPQPLVRREDIRGGDAPSAYSPYARTPGPQSMPSLKPYGTPHTQSPITQYSGITRSSIVSPIEAAERERDFYGSRQSYGAQHQIQSSGSPHQSHHYSSPSQQPSMAYQSQQQQQPTSFPAYGAPGSQSHVQSPTMQYAHSSRSKEPVRESMFRESVPQSREVQWPPPQAQPQSASSRMQPDVPWPPPKPTPAPQPTQSPWASQHGSATKLMREAPQPAWSSAPPSHLNLRDERDLRDPRESRDRDPRPDRYAIGLRESPVPTRAEERYAVLDSQRPAPDARMIDQRMDPRDSRDPRSMGHPHHQHSHSGSLGRVMYNSSPVPSRDHIGGPPSGPPQVQNPAYSQRYSTPGPPRGEIPQQVPRSYTPVSAQHHQYEMQMQLREAEFRREREREREREMSIREREMHYQRQQSQHQQRALDDDMHHRREVLAAQDRMRGGPPPPEEQQQQHQQQLQQQQQFGRHGAAPPDYGRSFQGELRGQPPPHAVSPHGGSQGQVQDHLRMRPPPEGYPPSREPRY